MSEAKAESLQGVAMLARLRHLYAARPLRALLAGALIGSAFPPFGFWPGLLGFALLLRQLDGIKERRRLREAFVCAWTAGLSFFLISTWWVGEAFLVDVAQHGWQAPFAVFFLAGGLALLWGAAGAAYRLLAPAHAGRAAVFAMVFAVFEWLRGHILTGFPWDLPGEVWRAGSALSQGAAVIGVYGMGLVTVFIAAAPGILKPKMGGPEALTLSAAAAILVLIFAWGTLRLHGAAPTVPSGLRIRVVQPDIGQGEKWSREALPSIVIAYAELTSRAVPRRPDVVVWPEAAIPADIDEVLAPGAWSRAVIENALQPGQVLLLGAERVGGDPGAPRYFNSVLALRRTAIGLERLGLYDKHHLVPFGEYMPFDALAARIGFKALVHMAGDGFTPGPRPVALSLPGLPAVQPLICYESLFPSTFARTGVRPQWIVNVSNDAWFGDTSGPWQHLNLASYRAIEEGVPMVRATPTGVSAIIDAYGRPLSTLGMERAGVLDSDLPGALKPTLYTRWRDAPFWILCVIAGLFAAPFPGVRTKP